MKTEFYYRIVDILKTINPKDKDDDIKYWADYIMKTAIKQESKEIAELKDKLYKMTCNAESERLQLAKATDTISRRNTLITDLRGQIPKIKFDNNHHELDDIDLGEISRQIEEGYSSGHLNNGEGKSIYYELKVNVWKD